MPAVLYDGKAFLYDGKLYVGETCPPCCCVPNSCCIPTGKWHCAEGDEFKHPKKVVGGQVSVSGFPSQLVFYTSTYQKTWFLDPWGVCQYKIDDSFKENIITGADALNGTYAAELLALGGAGPCLNADAPEGTCESWTNNCRWYTKIASVPLSHSYRYYLDRHSSDGSTVTEFRDRTGATTGYFDLFIDGVGGLGLRMRLSSNDADAGGVTTGLQETNRFTWAFTTDFLDDGDVSSPPGERLPSTFTHPQSLPVSYCTTPTIANAVRTLSYSGVNDIDEQILASDTGCGDNIVRTTKIYSHVSASMEYEALL